MCRQARLNTCVSSFNCCCARYSALDEPKWFFVLLNTQNGYRVVNTESNYTNIHQNGLFDLSLDTQYRGIGEQYGESEMYG